MRLLVKSLMVVSLVACVMAFCVKLNAVDRDEDHRTSNQVAEGIGDNPFKKLGRGIVNIAFGVCEIPLKIYDTDKEYGGVAACSWGVLKGIGFFIIREVVGVVEVITFPMPLPGCVDNNRNPGGWGYGPMMYPEWVIDEEHDPYNTVYKDQPIN